MKEKAIEISIQNDKKIQSGRKSTIKQPTSHSQSKKPINIKDEEENYEINDDDEGDQQINEEFKDVIRGVINNLISSNKELH